MSDTLRNQLPQTVSVDFSNRVRVAIDQEAVVMSPAAAEFDDRRSSEWRRPLIGLAAAASVTMAVGLGFMLSSSPDTQESTLAESTIPAVPPVEQLTSRDRLNSYLASHNELASMNGGRGLLPYVQTVYYSNDR